MATTLPELTRTIDDDFLNTWYEVRPDAKDNILESNVLLLALKEHGCLTPQVGGTYVTRSVSFGTKNKQNFQKGTVLTQSETDIDTMARWDWKYFAVDVNRSLVDDSKNSGKFKRRDYIARRLERAKDSLEQDIETDLFRYDAYAAAPKNMNGLLDIAVGITVNTVLKGSGAADYDTYASGTSNGNINRTNTWWRNWASEDGQDSTESVVNKLAADPVSPYSLNLLPDMRHFFNMVSANQESPNLILCDQSIFEAYEDEVADKQQIVRTSFDKKAADLGFETLTFKGATMSYSSKLAGSMNMFFLNLNHIELVYNPNVWFDMTNWKETANQFERVAYISCMTTGLITDQPRRHGVLEYTS